MEIIIPPLNYRNKTKKAPVSVHIVTPQNITEVTADMHRNALTTLGLEHAEITIASPTEASGLRCPCSGRILP